MEWIGVCNADYRSAAEQPFFGKKNTHPPKPPPPPGFWKAIREQLSILKRFMHLLKISTEAQKSIGFQRSLITSETEQNWKEIERSEMWQAGHRTSVETQNN